MRALLITPLLLALAGCVEFESQTILVRLDKATDTLHVRLIYHGLYAGRDGGDPKEDVDEALKQLKKVVERGTRFYLLDNWPLEADVGKPEEGEEDKPGNALLRPFTKVKNGRFFLDRDGKLCAWQDLEISKASAFLEQANRFFTLAVMTGQVDAMKEVDETTRRLTQQWVAKGEKWLVLDDRGLALRVPVSDADAARLKKAWLDDAVDVVERDTRKRDEMNAEGGAAAGLLAERTLTEAQVKVLAGNRLSLIHDAGLVTLRLGAGANGHLRFDWFNRGVYKPNLLEPVKQGEVPPELPAPLEKQLDVEDLVERFRPPPPEAKDGAGER